MSLTKIGVKNQRTIGDGPHHNGLVPRRIDSFKGAVDELLDRLAVG